MEEDSAVKAPVTRLRRRLSVEQSDDVNSPAPATPTKKRGGRLAAKPQLELIDEHGTNVTPSKRTTRRTSAIKDAAEAAEEKAVTPSRRSTRIKSNTSIVLETTQTVNSPRAKRAARRTSQVGSDSESSVTPIRTTRRTRKDSASSVEKLEITLSGKPNITEVIIEEENISVKSDDTTKGGPSSPPIRKSPRLREKRQDNNEKKSLDNIGNEDRLTSGNSAENQLNLSKQKNERNSLEHTNHVENIIQDNIPEETLNTSKQSRNKERKSLEQTSNEDTVTNVITSESELNVSKQSKKKDRKSLNQTNDDEKLTYNETSDDELNISKGNQKKSRKSIVESSSDVEIRNTPIDTLNISKKGRKSIIESSNDIEISNTSMDTLNVSKKGRKSLEKPELEKMDTEDVLNESKKLKNETEISSSTEPSSNQANVQKENSEENLSDSILMIKELDKKPRKKSSLINKSTSDLDGTNSFQQKRQRTKSWTISSLHQESDGVFFSDNESNKKKINKRTSKEFKRQSQHLGSGDNKNNDISSVSEKSKIDSPLHTSLKSRISKEFSSPNKSEIKPIITETISPQGNKENIIVSSTTEQINESSSLKFFEKAPTAILQSTVFFEDSDTDSKGKGRVVQLETEDQCVPVIDNKFVAKDAPTKPNESDLIINQEKDKDDSCEPMDIDETMPNNVSLTEFQNEKFNKSENKEKEAIPSSPLMDTSLNKSSNKSKRKSSLSNTQNLEKSQNENKSTLILSQLKDVSSSEHSVSKSPKVSNDQLSKSVSSIATAKDKALDKKNLSQDYSTSTPLQQKRFQKHGMQINSSILDSSNIDIKQAKSNNASKNEMSKISQSSDNSSEEDSESEDEEHSSKGASDLLDDEADVASDDYESGDSRDDEERRYEDENEIVEKGETLDSEDELSDDTDYEKDSFVVSSDEEDNELLSGSGDDLSMSDNELSMSKKSKKKYDDRKQKEQKKASKEMYESRHKLNNSDNTLKSKKNKKRQQIESDSEESEEEVGAPVKRNKHLRLDSTHDDELDKSNASDSLTKKKSKAKRLSESVCDESVTKEQEISAICDKNTTLPNDPLSVQIKLEPKTPMKDLNISTVHINDNIEEVEVDNNVSIMRSNEGADPLQATMVDEEESSLSENSEIMNNYDSVLDELNKAGNTKTVKSLDMSLNLNKKTKNLKEPIIDQLNLTKTKKQKKGKGNDVVEPAKPLKSQNKDRKSTTVGGDSSSDSIDLQLLFSEDSNSDENTNDKNSSQNLNKTKDLDDFIPLKRTPGKMNILMSEDNNSAIKTTLNESRTKKKNKKRQSQADNISFITGDDDQENNEIQIIVDTQGTHEGSTKPLNISLTSSAKKKKNRHSVSFLDNEQPTLEVATNDDDAPEEVPYESTKKNKKNRKSSENRGNETLTSEDTGETSANISSNLSSAKKKKSRVSESHSEKGEQETPQIDLDLSVRSSKKQKTPNVSLIVSEDNACESSLNVSMKSEKKKKKRLSETLNINDQEPNDATEISLNVSTSSAKKNKQKLKEIEAGLDDIQKEDKNVSIGSAKKQKVKEITQIIESELDTATTNSDGALVPKKRKRKSSGNEVIESVVLEDNSNIPTYLNESLPGSQKKKLKISQNKDDVTVQDADVPKKKNKKRKERDDDVGNTISKMFKENSFDKVHITRLPASVINKLEDQPSNEILESKKLSLVSTTPFIVEETRRRRNKPSKFLEESVYLNDDHVEKKQKGNLKRPKVLPFIPTAVTSGSGFTTSFQINIIPHEVQFVAQTKNVTNFKNEYLYGKKIKRLGTYETYKKHRSAKMSKF